MESPKHDQNDKKEDGFIQRLQKNDSKLVRKAHNFMEYCLLVTITLNYGKQYLFRYN